MWRKYYKVAKEFLLLVVRHCLVVKKKKIRFKSKIISFFFCLLRYFPPSSITLNLSKANRVRLLELLRFLASPPKFEAIAFVPLTHLHIHVYITLGIVKFLCAHKSISKREFSYIYLSTSMKSVSLLKRNLDTHRRLIVIVAFTVGQFTS